MAKQIMNKDGGGQIAFDPQKFGSRLKNLCSQLGNLQQQWQDHYQQQHQQQPIAQQQAAPAKGRSANLPATAKRGAKQLADA